MPLDSRIQDVLSRWEQACQHGREISPEELCQDQPELLAEVRQKIQELKAVNRHLDLALTSDQARTGQELATATSCQRTQLPPLTLSGYDVLELLGQGGMGVVYKARDRQRNAVVALKTLPWQDPSALYRFKHEFRALADVVHPNLVALYELIADGPQWFFTMEYVEGLDFLRYIRGEAQGGVPSGGMPLDVPRLREALLQLAEGISALHGKGKLHRDIKPSNVMVTRAGRVMLLDFGLAVELDPAGQHQSLASGVVGTMAYMAPEQAAGMPVSPASDWYSVGVMLYEVLSGRLPYLGGFYQVLRDKQEIDAPPPRQLASGIPEDLNGLCMELLQRDPKARPTGQEVLHRLGQPTAGLPASPAQPVRPRPLFVGRQTHLQVLSEAFAEMRQGQTIAVHIHGRSGAGKSALVQHFLDGLGEREEAVVLAGRCYEQESVPYKALDSLVDALSHYLGHLPLADAQALMPRDVLHLARVFPVLRGVEAVARAPARAAESPDPHEARRRAAVALRELLARLGDRRPLVLFIDDLQWGDLDSAALLTDLLRPPDPPVLMLLGASRSEDASGSPFLAAHPGRRGGPDAVPVWRELAVESLTSSEAQDLALTLLGRGGPEMRIQAEAIARESGGNPFFVWELVQHLHGGGEPGGAAQGEVALDQVLWGRIARLPDEARRLIEVIAVAGRPLRQADACQAAGAIKEQAALAALRSGRLVRALRMEIDTYHDRIRETVLARLEPAALADCHRRLAETLEAGGMTDAEVLAVHFHGAGQAARAGHYYATAAAQAVDALAFEHAARLYRLALELSPTGGENERLLRCRLGDALANAGRGWEAAQEYLQAAQSAEAGVAMDLRRSATDQLLRSGHADVGLVLLREVLAEVGLRMPSSPRRALWGLLAGRALLWLRGLRFRRRAEQAIPVQELRRIDTCWLAGVSLSLIDTIQGAFFHTRHLQLALRAGEPLRMVRALAMEVAHTSSTGTAGLRRAERISQAAEAIAREIADPYALALVLLTRAIAVGISGRWKQCHDLCAQSEQIFRTSCTGVTWELDTLHRFSLWSLAYRGSIAEASRLLPLVLEEARERGDLYGETNISTFVAPLLRLAADDPLGARRELRQSMERWSHGGFHLQHLTCLMDEAQIDLYLGDPQAGFDRLVAQWPAVTGSLLLRVQQLRVFMHQVRARCALAVAMSAPDPEPYWRVAERDIRLLKREGVGWADALAKLLDASMACVGRDVSGAIRLLRQVIDQFEALDMALHGAAARRRLGQLLPGAAGCTLVAEADSALRSCSVISPARLTTMLAPGFPEIDSTKSSL
jgi:eukaryotic-like serine/threonine-protein kinase